MSFELPSDPSEVLAHLTRLHVQTTLSDHPEEAAAWWLSGTLTGLEPSTALLADLDPDELVGEPPLSDLALALLVAVAGHPDAPRRWRHAVEDALEDARGRPRAWRANAALALRLAHGLDLPEGPASDLLAAVIDAPALAPSDDALAAAAATVRRLRRAAWLEAWRRWARDAAGAALDGLRSALDTLDAAAPLAAAEAAPDALGRALLAARGDDELTLAVLPDAVLLEWTGDGAPPTAARLDDHPLTPVAGRRTIADRAWELREPPRAGAVIALDGGDAPWTVTLP